MPETELEYLLYTKDGSQFHGDCIMKTVNSKGDYDEWEQKDGICKPLSWVRNYEAYSVKTTLLTDESGFVCEEIDKRGHYSKTEYSKGVATLRAYGQAIHFRREIEAAFGLAWTDSEYQIILGGYNNEGAPYSAEDEVKHDAHYWKDGKWHMDEIKTEEIEPNSLKVVDSSPGRIIWPEVFKLESHDWDDISVIYPDTHEGRGRAMADGLFAWGSCYIEKRPKSFGTVIGKIAAFLDIEGTPESFKEYHHKWMKEDDEKRAKEPICSIDNTKLHIKTNEDIIPYTPPKPSKGYGPIENYRTLFVEFEITVDKIENDVNDVCWGIWTAVFDYLQTLPADTTFGPFAILREKPKLKEDIWFYRLWRKIKSRFRGG